MCIDFTPIDNNQIKMLAFSQQFALADLAETTNSHLDTMVALVKELTDVQILFVAQDTTTDDGLGWNVAHLLVHTTATAEEGAAISSILARGLPYPFEPRLRYETDWQTITTTAQCLQRLAESRRIRLSYLHAWPDTPHLTTYRGLTAPLLERFGQLNATASYLLGLWHEHRHLDHLRNIVQQATAT